MLFKHLCLLLALVSVVACKKTNTMSFHDVEAIYYDNANIMVSFRVGDAFTQDAPKNLEQIKNEKLIGVYEDGEMLSNREGAGISVNRPTHFKVDLLIVVDVSGSVEDKLNTIKKSLVSFATESVKNNKDGRIVRLAIRTFDGSEETQLITDFTSDLNILKTKIESITAGQDPSTNLYGAVVEAATLMINHEVEGDISNNLKKKGLVIFTDGKDQAARNTATEAITALNAATSSLDFVYGVAVSGENYGGGNFLKNFGEQDKGYFLIDRNFKELEGKLRGIALRLHTYADSYFLAKICSPKRNGIHYLSFKIAGSAYATKNIEFNANGFTKGCDIKDEKQWLNPASKKYLSSSALLSYTEMGYAKSFYSNIKSDKSLVYFKATALKPSYDGSWVSNYSNFTSSSKAACHLFIPAGSPNVYAGTVMTIVDFGSVNSLYSAGGEAFIGVNFVTEDNKGNIYLLQCRELANLMSSDSLENIDFKY